MNSDKRNKTIRDAANSCPKNNKLQYRLVRGLTNSEAFQNEIKAHVQKNYPELLKDALASSGNLHEPKVVPLIYTFQDAFLKTRLMKDVVTQVDELGYNVARVTYEKIHLVNDDGVVLFNASVLMRITNK